MFISIIGNQTKNKISFDTEDINYIVRDDEKECVRISLSNDVSLFTSYNVNYIYSLLFNDTNFILFHKRNNNHPVIINKKKIKLLRHTSLHCTVISFKENDYTITIVESYEKIMKNLNIDKKN